MSNKQILKAYERYDYDGKVVPGSLVLRSKKPKNGKWKEVTEFLCCNPPSIGNVLTFRVRIFEDQVTPNWFRAYIRDFGDSSEGIIYWGDGTFETFITPPSDTLPLHHIFPAPGDYIVRMEFIVLNKIQFLVLGDSSNKEGNYSGRVTWINGLDIFNKEGINELQLSANDLTSISLPQIALDSYVNPGYIDLSNTYIKSLVVNNTEPLEGIDLFDTPIESLVINAPDIIGSTLNWFNTNLSSFDFYKYPSIYGIDIANCKFTSFDVHDLSILYNVYCVNNPISDVNISGCSSLTFVRFNVCNLTQTSVDHILTTLDGFGNINGYCELADGTNAAPGPAGLAAKTSLEGKGWYVVTN